MAEITIDHTCRRVAAIKRALRPAQNFDLANVVEFLFEEMIADEWNVVERDRDGRIGRHRNRLRADAANLDVVAGEIGFREGEIRNFLHQIGPARDLARGQLFLRQRGDRDRNGLDIALDLRRGDDDAIRYRPSAAAAATRTGASVAPASATAFCRHIAHDRDRARERCCITKPVFFRICESASSADNCPAHALGANAFDRAIGIHQLRRRIALYRHRARIPDRRPEC